MRKANFAAGIAAAGMMTIGASAAHAVVTYDADVTPDVIFGSGVTNGGFTVDRSNGIELGLRGKLRFNENDNPENTFNSNGDGTYSFDTGSPTDGFSWLTDHSTTPVWSFEWSINSDYAGDFQRTLDDLAYQLDIDFDPGTGTLFRSFDPINDTDPTKGIDCYDHGIGINTTANGGGDTADCGSPGGEGTYAGLIANGNVAQNSWNMEFFNEGPWDIFDPSADGVYTFGLSAFNSNNVAVASTSIDIIVGEGASEVPEPATLALMGIGLAGIGCAARRRRPA